MQSEINILMSMSHESPQAPTPTLLTVRHLATVCFKWQEAAHGQKSTDQVIICMLGLEHPRDILQIVRVDLLRAAPGEGHGDDAFCDICEIELISLLHHEVSCLRQEKERERNESTHRRE